ncbi:MAG: hypothetical protein ACXW07_01825 [Nitrososphaeraceae archaeon]
MRKLIFASRNHKLDKNIFVNKDIQREHRANELIKQLESGRLNSTITKVDASKVNNNVQLKLNVQPSSQSTIQSRQSTIVTVNTPVVTSNDNSANNDSHGNSDNNNKVKHAKESFVSASNNNNIESNNNESNSENESDS